MRQSARDLADRVPEEEKEPEKKYNLWSESA